jgi:G3E family GTPase
MNERSPVPLTIVTGFLGSGKTTLINFVLEEVGDKEKLAIIKNEIGDVAVDSKIITGKNIVMKELLNGCVCCTLVGSLEDSLEELVDTVKPDRILIEASGAANPAILAVNIDRLAFVNRDMIVTMIDALNFNGYKDKTVVGRMQHQFTDLIVINRAGEVDEYTIEDVLDEIYGMRPGIPVVKTVTGRVHPDVLFGLREGMKRVELADMQNEHMHKDHLHEDEIEVFTYRSEKRLRRDCFEAELKKLSEEYFRVKGFVWFEGADTPGLVNFVCGRFVVEDVNEKIAGAAGKNAVGKNESSLSFIGKRIGRYEEPVVERLRKCEVQGRGE